MSGRARGKHTPRQPIAPDTSEGDGIGASVRMQGTPSPIPGGRVHVENAEVIRQRTTVPDSPAEIKDLNAHGVDPGTHTARERAETMRGPNGVKPMIPQYEEPEVQQVPVPVRIVQSKRPAVLRTSSQRSFTLPAAGNEPARVAGQDFQRVRLLLLNESSSSDIRVATNIRDLNNGGGALLPWPSNSYLTLHTQDEMYAISADTGTPKISIVQEFEQPW